MNKLMRTPKELQEIPLEELFDILLTGTEIVLDMDNNPGKYPPISIQLHLRYMMKVMEITKSRYQVFEVRFAKIEQQIKKSRIIKRYGDNN